MLLVILNETQVSEESATHLSFSFCIRPYRGRRFFVFSTADTDAYLSTYATTLGTHTQVLCVGVCACVRVTIIMTLTAHRSGVWTKKKKPSRSSTQRAQHISAHCRCRLWQRHDTHDIHARKQGCRGCLDTHPGARQQICTRDDVSLEGSMEPNLGATRLRPMCIRIMYP
ncbi:hypothetical protein CSPX01_06447 [Colletotrichum filicis]|nr:hypothetical protein CSPX01_06447 [Colletotrichum filicis]